MGCLFLWYMYYVLQYSPQSYCHWPELHVKVIITMQSPKLLLLAGTSCKINQLWLFGKASMNKDSPNRFYVLILLSQHDELCIKWIRCFVVLHIKYFQMVIHEYFYDSQKPRIMEMMIFFVSKQKKIGQWICPWGL